MASRDFLDEMMAERTKINPDFPRLLDAAAARRQLQKDPSLTASRRSVARPEPK